MNFGRKIALYSVATAAVFGLIVLAINPFAKNFTTEQFHPFENYDNSDSAFVVDLSDAVTNGIMIPGVKQLPGGKFVFSFVVKNNKLGSRKLSYKIYYQNETYKEVEFEDYKGRRYERQEAENNFYGSWEDTGIEFKDIPELGWFESLTITDSFRIVGNPRNESKYYGEENRHGVSEEDVQGMIRSIRENPVWFSDIQAKAKKNNISLDEQLYRDALYSINVMNQEGEKNNRWKRNPRMGSYRFMLVVTTTDNVDGIPVSVRNISMSEPDGHAINPFYYFMYGAGAVDENCEVNIASEELKVTAQFNPGAGVYVNPFEFNDNTFDTVNYCRTCGADSTLFVNAQFGQYFHYEDKQHKLQMLSVVKDVVEENMTRTEYDNQTQKAQTLPRTEDYFRITGAPCATVKSDPVTKTITMFNPGNDTSPYRKEQVGVKTRIGMTYGKYRACVQFPKILSADHVWNGLDNAVWLLNQDDAAWNTRSICEGGYIPKEDSRGAQAVRKNQLNQSEIRFDVMKCSPYWPNASYVNVPQPPEYDASATGDVVVACTNWDLACMAPEKHVKGVMPFMIDNRKFDLHRWDSWYQAITIRTPLRHEDVFNGEYFWYEIEWTPQHIAWRIGPEKNRLQLVGYMDKTVTTIPDNQMIMVIAQEFQDSEWWKPAPFDQQNIPYPKNPLTGKIIAVEVE